MQQTEKIKTLMRRIPEGPILGSIQLEAAKAFPTKQFKDYESIRFAYADISKQENIQMQIKYAPHGAETSKHPQLILFVKGDYHVENWLDYGGGSDPFKWTTWLEVQLNALDINKLIFALAQAETLRIQG